MAVRKRKTSLMEAAKQGDVGALRALIKAGADVNTKDSNGRPPLMGAAGSVEAVRVLIEAGADVNAKDSHGMTPLTWAKTGACRTKVYRLSLAKRTFSPGCYAFGGLLFL